MICAADGVDGPKGWWSSRRRAWLDLEPIYVGDAHSLGVDYMSDKKRIAEAFGYASFGEMILDRVEDMQILIENLPPICSKLRLDVASYARKRAAQRAAANAQRFSGTLTALPRSAARLAAHTRAFSAAQAPPSALH